MRVQTIDAHVEGGPLRLVVDGFPAPYGKTMLQKRDWAERHADGLRRAIMLEPRGHADMQGAVLTEPVSPGSHAGVLFMHNAGYSTMSGHGIIAVTTIALERHLLMPGGDGLNVVYDTPAGTVRARATLREGRVVEVAFQSVPSFVLYAGVFARTATRQLRADVAFGGAFYAIVDSEMAGVGVDVRHLPDLRRVGGEIKDAIERAHPIVHPLEPKLNGLAGTIFTGPAGDSAGDLRNATVFAYRAVERSPSGTGTAAVMAVVDAMGLLGSDASFVHEGLLGTRMRGRLAERTTVGEYSAIIADIRGSAWITGEHMFLADPADPLGDGFLI
jgi:proline racemase